MSRSTWVRIVGVVTLLVMFATPLVPAASAQDDTCDEGQTVDAETGECIDQVTNEEEEPVEDDIADEPADADPDDVEVGGTVENVYLLGFACPADWDFTTESLDDAYASCSGSADVTWSILRDGATVASVSVGEQADLATAGADLTPGSWTIQPNSGSSGYADCVVYDISGNTTTSVSQPADAGLNFDLAAGDTLDCDWFVAAGAVDGGDGEDANPGLVAGDDDEADAPTVGGDPINSLTFTMSACPYGIKSLSSYGPTGCDLDVPVPVDFEISIDGTLVATGTGQGRAGSAVTFTTSDGGPIPSGEWEVEITTPNGHEGDHYYEGFLTCVTTTAGGTASPIADSSIIDYLDIYVSPRDDTVCKAYMSEAMPRAGATGAVVFTANQCPSGVIPSAGNTACNLPLTIDVVVGLGLGDGSVLDEFTLDAATPSWTIPSVDAGMLRLFFDVPDSLVQPNLYCNVRNTLGIPFSYGGKVSDDGTPGQYILVGIGHTVSCWVTVSTDKQTSLVTDTVFTCPAESDPAALTATERTAQCTTTAGITVDNTVNGKAHMRVKTSENGSVGHALASGQNTLTLLKLPEGTAARFASCELAAANGTRQSIQPDISSDNAITIKVLAGDNLDCDWFLGAALMTASDPEATDPTPAPSPTVASGTDTAAPPAESGGGNGNTGGGNAQPSTGNDGNAPNTTSASAPADQISSIVVRRWDCDETVDPTHPFEDLTLACVAPDGDASWTIGGLQPGELTVQLATDGETVAFCSTDAVDDALDTFPEPAPIDTQGVLTVTVAPASTVFCDWFQFPERQ